MTHTVGLLVTTLLSLKLHTEMSSKLILTISSYTVSNWCIFYATQCS